MVTGFNREFCSRGGLVGPGLFPVESAPRAQVDAWVYVPDGEGPFPRFTYAARSVKPSNFSRLCCATGSMLR